MMSDVPRRAPVGKRRPGGKARPVIAVERSSMAKDEGGCGVNTSSSRWTSVN